ncbi:MAG: ABC transporter permease, partial [Chloroflexi bacterium]|nr:ABC transporter permease [Chloroflexota bacterium]
MLGYLIRRLFYAVLAVWAVSIISFFIINLPPGDYVTSYVAQLRIQGSIIQQEEIENLREFYGLDQPIYAQYLKWMNQIRKGNLGFSFEFGLPVNDVIGERLVLTMILAAATIVFIWLVAIPIGILSAVRQYSIWDHTFTFFGFVGLAVPDFMLALVMMYLAFVFFNFSVGGLFSPEFVTASWSVARVLDL